MTIGRRLLVAFLSLIVVCTGGMTALAYHLSRDALRAQIEVNLETQAVTVMRHLDRLLFERLQNLASWRRLDVMQELRVDDVDKRLARFLGDLKQAYRGTYRSLYCTRNGRVVAASEPELIGQPAKSAAVWQRLHWYDTELTLGYPGRAPGASVLMQVPLTDAYTGGALGTLHAVFNWDRVVEQLEPDVEHDAARTLLIDGSGRVIAVSASLREQGWSAGGDLEALAVRLHGHGIRRVDLRMPGLGQVLLGFASSSARAGLDALGWRVLVLVPVDEAFAPIHRQLAWLLGLMLVTSTGAGLLALRLSDQVARPIQRLTAYTRAFAMHRGEAPPLLDSRDEVGELARSFHAMIAALEQYEAEVLRVGKLAAAGEMAANLAHEIRTPLGILRSSAQLLERRPGLDERGREMVAYIISECDRINQLVTRLLDSARPRAPKFTTVDVPSLIEHVAELVRAEREQRGILLECRCDVEPAEACFDREQMIQVLLNLVLNAIQVLPQGGRIVIHARREGPWLVFAVDDDGPGVPESDRDRVLEPFVGHRQGGTGLGLTVVQQLVRLHRGRLTIATSSMGGASFTVYVPAAPDEVTT